MIEEGTQPNSTLREILVWRCSRFTRKQENMEAIISW